MIDLIANIQQNEFDLSITALEQPDLTDIKKNYQKQKGNFGVAEFENQILGTTSLLDIGNHMAALRKMFVHSSYRGAKIGIAKKLLKTLIPWAETHQIKEIYLGTTPKFFAAHRFYEKNNFSEIIKHDLPETFPIMKVDTKFYKFELKSERIK